MIRFGLLRKGKAVAAMIVGIPTEVKDRESRVSTTPAGVGELVAHGHTVLVESCAGHGSGFADEAYAQAGAQICQTHAGIFENPPWPLV
jgi:alanine dehydrogenase